MRSKAMKQKTPKLKKVPIFKTDEEAEAFLDQDLSDLDFSQFKPMHFEIRPKEKSINLRLSEGLLDAVRENAKREGVPYQRFIRHLIERCMKASKRSKAKADGTNEIPRRSQGLCALRRGPERLHRVCARKVNL